jgi:hypothetical protein
MASYAMTQDRNRLVMCTLGSLRARLYESHQGILYFGLSVRPDEVGRTEKGGHIQVCFQFATNTSDMKLSLAALYTAVGTRSSS